MCHNLLELSRCCLTYWHLALRLLLVLWGLMRMLLVLNSCYGSMVSTDWLPIDLKCAWLLSGSGLQGDLRSWNCRGSLHSSGLRGLCSRTRGFLRRLFAKSAHVCVKSRLRSIWQVHGEVSSMSSQAIHNVIVYQLSHHSLREVYLTILFDRFQNGRV